LLVLPILTVINTPNLYRFITTKVEPTNRTWTLYKNTIEMINYLNGLRK
jgi:hypothetical protein